MSEERQRQIRLLVRKNEAKKEHPYYLTELSHALKQRLTDEDLIDLGMTDNLSAQFNSATHDADSHSVLKAKWPLKPESQWLQVCFCIAEQLESEPVALLAGPYDACGAVRTKAECALVNASSVLAFDRDTVRLQSLNSDSGLYLDLYEENANWCIELKVWGDWHFRAKQCLTEASIARH